MPPLFKDPFSEKMFQDTHLYLVASGAGAGIQNTLWMIPGTSSFLVGSSFPYSMDDTDDFLGFKPASYCSREEALQLAMEAYMRAKRHSQLSGIKAKAVGLAVTAVVASIKGPPRRGDHRVFVAAVTDAGAFIKYVVMKKGEGRSFRTCDNQLAHVYAEDVMTSVSGGEGYGVQKVPEEELREIFFKHPGFSSNGTRLLPGEAGVLFDGFYCGSFNPLHQGHREIAREANRGHLGRVAYTICADHPYKPGLTVPTMLERAVQFRMERTANREANLLFTHGDPLFVQKFTASPGAIFVVGADTFERMLDPKWGPDTRQVWDSIYFNQVNLWISNRLQDGVLLNAREMAMKLVPAEKFWNRLNFLDDVQLVDVSSSKLREAASSL